MKKSADKQGFLEWVIDRFGPDPRRSQPLFLSAPER